MKRAEKIVRVIIEASGILGIICLIAMMMMTVADVILRYFFRQPIVGSVEISVVMMVCVVFLGIAWSALKGDHISVDLITGILSKRGRVFLDSFDNVVTMGLGLLIAIQSFSQAMFIREMKLKTVLLGIPRYPFLLVTAYGFFLLFLAAVILQLNVKKER